MPLPIVILYIGFIAFYLYIFQNYSLVLHPQLYIFGAISNNN